MEMRTQCISCSFHPRRLTRAALLLGGMIIGSLGVLDDLVTSQSAAVVEIHDANPSLGFRLTFQKAMRIGQDHVAATVNTLVLAYTGARVAATADLHSRQWKLQLFHQL